jgi:hypothetical protein
MPCAWRVLRGPWSYRGRREQTEDEEREDRQEELGAEKFAEREVRICG